MDNLKIFADEIQQDNLQLGWYKKGEWQLFGKIPP